jgi:hypothetical protein
MKKSIQLALISISASINKLTNEVRYAFVTEVTKDNPFKNGTMIVSANHAQNIATKCNAGSIEQLALAVGFQDSLLTVETNGSHKAGDRVLDREGNEVLVPVEDRSSYAPESLDKDGYRVYTKDGVTIDQLSAAVELGDTAITKLMVVNAMISASSPKGKVRGRAKSVSATTEEAPATSVEAQIAAELQ